MNGNSEYKTPMSRYLKGVIWFFVVAIFFALCILVGKVSAATWDEGCSNPNFRPDGEQYYASLHAGTSGLKNQFNPDLVTDDPMLLSFGVFTCPRLFKVYIPPGSSNIRMNFFAPNGALIGVAERFKVHPQLNYCGVKYSNFSVLPWSGPGTLSQLLEKDYQIQNMGGSFFTVAQFIRDGLDEGGWLYLKVMDVDDANDLFQFQYVIQVNRTKYLNWYNNVQWDDNGDPITVASQPVPINVNLAGSVSSPVTVVDKIVFTAKGVGGSGQYEYRFFLKSGTDAWVSVQEYSTNNMWTWTSTTPGSYLIGVHIRNKGSTVTYEKTSTLRYTVEGSDKLEATIKVLGKQIIITIPDGVDITILK